MQKSTNAAQITILDTKSTVRVSGIFVQTESSTKNTACNGKVSHKVWTSATKAAKITILDTKITDLEEKRHTMAEYKECV